MSGPVTLTRGQFAQSKAGQKQGATYERYLSYVNHARSQVPGGTSEALAPAAAPDFNTLVGIAQRALGPSLTDAQITAKANGAVSGAMAPITAGISDLYGKRLGTVQNAISGYTNTAGDALAHMPLPDYGAAVQSRAAADSALTGFLGTQGQGAADALKGKLAAIGAPDASQALANTSTAGVAGQAAGGLLAAGTAGIDRTLADKTAGQAYAESLPGLVQLAGMQNQRLASAQNASGLQTALSDVQTKAPELALGLEQNLMNQRTSDKRQSISLASSLLNNYNTNELKKAIALGGFGVDYAKLASQDTRAAEDRSSREAIAASNRAAAAARSIAHDNAATGRTKITAGSAAANHLDSLTTSAFQKAASAASRMKAGTYGSSSSQAAQLGAILGGSAPTAGSPYDYHRAYNSVYGMIQGTLGQYVNEQGLRRLTLRALAAGGYPVTVAKG